MNFKKLLIVLLIITISLGSIFASSFYLGFDAGYALNFLDTDTPWEATWYLPSHGMDLEVNFEYFPLSWLSINTGFRYLQRSFNYKELAYDIPSYTFWYPFDYIEMQHYLELPLSIRFLVPITDSSSLFLGGGGFIGVLLGSNAFSLDDGAFYFENRPLDFEYGDNRFSAGIIAETGFDFRLSDRTRLLTSFKYLRSLTSLVKDYQKNTYNRYHDTLAFTIGARFALGE